MFKLIDTRDGKVVAANLENGQARRDWLNRKRIPQYRWASYQMRAA